MLVHDVIKIRLVEDGYLPNYPYHMMSDREMIAAFMGTDGAGYFQENYKCLDRTNDVLKIMYYQLVLSVAYYAAMYQVAEQEIPDWVYSYMLGSTISTNSGSLDIHDLNASLHTENDSDEFTLASSVACLNVSAAYIGYALANQRTAIPLEGEKKQAVEDFFKSIVIDKDETSEEVTDITLYDIYHNTGDMVYIRPITMFGEPHVLKSLRLRQIKL